MTGHINHNLCWENGRNKVILQWSIANSFVFGKIVLLNPFLFVCYVLFLFGDVVLEHNLAKMTIHYSPVGG